MLFNLPESINFVIDTLIKNGHRAYIVGGCVRDLLCGKEPNDYDITTSATPDTVISLFKKTVATGLKHGTVTVIINQEPIEVTTFRTENGYSDSRHPSSVNFVTDVKDDLARRDFTINSMCYNHTEGLIDCFGGKADIDKKVLRAVGDAKTRFSEDALRILRLFRFAATLDFNIEESTLSAAIECAPLLKNISAERIFTELKKTACGINPAVIEPLFKTEALSKYSVSFGDTSKIARLKGGVDLRTFAFLYAVSDNLSETAALLKCSNSFKAYCKKMQYFAENIIGDGKPSIKNALRLASINTVSDAFIYYRDILNLSTNAKENALNGIIKNNEPYLLRHLDITGDDILKLGFSGSEIASKLEILLQRVIENPQLNQKEILIKIINH